MRRKTKKSLKIMATAVITATLIIIAGWFLNLRLTEGNVKEEYNTAVSMINDKHEFQEGYNKLKSLGLERAESRVKEYSVKVKVAKSLNEANKSISDGKVEDGKDQVETAKKMADSEDVFAPAVKWLETDIKKYEEAVKEINDGAKPEEVANKYKFNHDRLTEVLKGKKAGESSTKEDENKEDTKSTESNSTPAKKAEAPARQAQSTASSIGATKVGSYDDALVKNFNHYHDAIVSYLMAYSAKVQEASGVVVKDVQYGGMDSNGIYVKLKNPKGDMVGYYLFRYNVNTQQVTLDSVQAGPVQTYPAVYQI